VRFRFSKIPKISKISKSPVRRIVHLCLFYGGTFSIDKEIDKACTAGVILFRHYYYYLLIFLITFSRNVIEIRFHYK